MMRLIARAAIILVTGGVVGILVVPAAQAKNLTLHSSAFAAGAAIPKRFSCQGAGVSPPLAWSGVPAATKSLALIVEDPDAPSGIWVHWVVYNLSPHTHALPQDAGARDLPAKAKAGRNSYKHDDYGGVCPPSGMHHYRFRLYALDTRLPIKDYTRQALQRAMRSHVLAHTQLMGTYRKQ